MLQNLSDCAYYHRWRETRREGIRTPGEGAITFPRCRVSAGCVQPLCHLSLANGPPGIYFRAARFILPRLAEIREGLSVPAEAASRKHDIAAAAAPPAYFARRWPDRQRRAVADRTYSAPIGSKAAGAAFEDTWTLDKEEDVAWMGVNCRPAPRSPSRRQLGQLAQPPGLWHRLHGGRRVRSWVRRSLRACPVPEPLQVRSCECR